MPRMWIIAWREFRLRVFTKAFMWVLLSLPLFVLFIYIVIVAVELASYNGKPVGYVDQAGVLDPNVQVPASSDFFLGGALNKPVTLLPFSSTDEAQGALEARRIQSYYVLAPDYVSTRQVELFYLSRPGSNAGAQFTAFLKANLLMQLDPAIARRATEGAILTVRTPDGAREYSDRQPWAMILPVVALMGVMIWIMSNSGTALQAIVEERENRTLEVLLTTISPGQFIAGKVMGIVGMGLAQLLGWGLFLLVLQVLSRLVPALAWLRAVSISGRLAAQTASVLLPTYVLLTAAMIAVGSTVGDAQESQQVSGLLSLPLAIPMWLLSVIIEHPNSALSVVLTVSPLTSISTIMVRGAFGSVPTWQWGLSVAIVSVCAVGAIWLAARAFRLGMLRFGKRIAWREVFGR